MATHCEASHWVAIHNQKAHYLFGYSWKHSKTPGAISPSLLAHHISIENCISEGISDYDLNGALPERPIGEHPYNRVHEFKSQFQAQHIHYWIPEFRISQSMET